ncbi:MAG: hypothetical protein AB7H80_08060 [Candidatus Kapaibacterium sp.]
MNSAQNRQRSRITSFHKVVLILTLLLIVATEWGEAQSVRRQNYYDFPTTGNVDKYAQGLEVDRTDDGGHILVGTVHHYDNASGTSFDLLNYTKLNSCGEVEWSHDINKAVGVPGYSSRGAAIKQTSDGGYIIVGSVKQPPALSTGGWDILLVKTDPNGIPLWLQRYSGFSSADDFGESVQEVYNPQTGSYDGYILTGGINNYTITGVCNGKSFQNSSLVIIRTDGGGNMLWNHTVRPSLPFGCTPTSDYHHYAYGYDIIQVDPESDGTLNNRFAIVGTMKGAVTFEDSFTCPGCFWQTNNSALILDVTDNVTSGVVNWARGYPIPNKTGIQGNTIGTSIQQTATGYAVGGTSLFSFNDNDIYFLETDFNGTMLRSFNYDVGGVETGSSIEVGTDYFYIVGAASEIPNPGPLNSSYDGIITAIDRSTGLSTWTKRFGGNNIYDALNGSVIEYNDRITAIGYSENFTPTTDYYFLNNIADDPHPDCSTCDEAETLTTIGIPGVEGVPFYNHDYVQQEAETVRLETPAPLKGTECECMVCADVTIAFQSGYGSFYDRGESFMQTHDEGYIMAGYTFDDPQATPGGFDILLTRANKLGAKQWSYAITESTATNVFEEAAYSVRQTPNDNGYILAGDITNYNLTDSNAYIVKLDQNGVPLWSWIYGNTQTGDYDVARSIKQTDDNGNGTMDNSDGFIFAGHTAPASLRNNGYLVKTKNNGSLGTTGWSYQYDFKPPVVQGTANKNEQFYDVVQTDDDNDGRADDGFIAVGYSDSRYVSQPGTLSGYNVLVVKVDKNGAIEWSRIYGTSYNDFAFSIQQTDDDHDGNRNDGYIIAGSTVTGGTNSDFYILKIAEDGALTWSAKIDEAPNDIARSAIQTADFSFAVAGDAGMANRSDQAFLFRISECGSEIFSTHHYPEDPLATQKEDHANELIQTMDEGFALFGSTCTYANNTGSAGKGDFYLIKTDCLGDVCLSGILTKTPTNPNSIEYVITPYLIKLSGPLGHEGEPVRLQLGEEYMICPDSPMKAKDRMEGEPDISFGSGKLRN